MSGRTGDRAALRAGVAGAVLALVALAVPAAALLPAPAFAHGGGGGGGGGGDHGGDHGGDGGMAGGGFGGGGTGGGTEGGFGGGFGGHGFGSVAGSPATREIDTDGSGAYHALTPGPTAFHPPGGYWPGFFSTGSNGGENDDHALTGNVPLGAVAYKLPSSCAAEKIGGVGYRRCGNRWYQPSFSGTSVVYQVVAPPK
ncbi:hypothetical protein [Ancylobacter lacus]|uniref:hypothetical protein n=1 Tax=Ancylobacter lacus TaxID=2579970 RepID=UPI001BCB01BA|nr:hypothetical protein [Ancylobacter lacus]MBS7540052.1 hypothetical protein [Ancylobacter lacus]